MNYENFVFCGSWRETLEGLKNEFGEEYAREALWNLMLAGTGGEIETERESIIGFINGAIMPTVNKKKANKGGRPKSINDQEIAQLKAEGLKNYEIAARLHCSLSSVEKANARNRKKEN